MNSFREGSDSRRKWTRPSSSDFNPVGSSSFFSRPFLLTGYYTHTDNYKKGRIKKKVPKVFLNVENIFIKREKVYTHKDFRMNEYLWAVKIIE